jgi:cation:H+ antiporter
MKDVLFVLLGIALLTAGGEALIRGALAAARRLGISPLLSGLLIVGFGTSAPELVVSVDAAISGRPDIALGNVVGSNISNILLILGACALIAPMAVRPLALRRDAVTGTAATVLCLLLIAAGSGLGRLDTLILLVALLAYLVWAYWSERNHAAPSGEVYKAEAEELSFVPASAPAMAAWIVLGLALLIGGSRVLLTGAIGIAGHLGVSEAVIGLTLVAVGTSLPEFAVSVIAALRRHADVAIGNVLGSNIFNLLGILGISALLQPLSVHARIVQFDQWVLLGTSLLLLLFLYTGHRLNRLEGGVLLAAYGGYGVLSFTVFAA